ncbi:hypothetical protein PMAYCL1PPCAC_29095, partial [Pristionchus mayeri]
CAGCMDTGVNCAQLSSRCSSPRWEKILNRYCPLTCGRCRGASKVSSSVSDCTDRASNCFLLSHRCFDPIYSPIMSENCGATCGKCRGSPHGDCDDLAFNCPLLVHRCDHHLFSTMMRRYCRKTCAVCTSDSSMGTNEIFARPEQNEGLSPLTTTSPTFFPYTVTPEGSIKELGRMEKLMEGANGIVQLILRWRRRLQK